MNREQIRCILLVIVLISIFFIINGCKTVKTIKYYESGQVSEVFYSSEFHPNWSNKESILKTGNIGISL